MATWRPSSRRRRFSSWVPYRVSIPGVISRDFFINEGADLRQAKLGYWIQKMLEEMQQAETDAQRGECAFLLRPGWLEWPICRRWAQTRTCGRVRQEPNDEFYGVGLTSEGTTCPQGAVRISRSFMGRVMHRGRSRRMISGYTPPLL
jgi:hypothetical protein